MSETKNDESDFNALLCWVSKHMRKAKCLLGFHDADADHWIIDFGVFQGRVETRCKYCNAKFWQSRKGQIAARKRHFEETSTQPHS